MSVLTYAQASVLCRVNGMPLQLGEYRIAVEGGSHAAVFVGVEYRLRPKAALTPSLAAICLAMGCPLFLKVNPDDWEIVTGLDRFSDRYHYAVPPERGE